MPLHRLVEYILRHKCVKELSSIVLGGGDISKKRHEKKSENSWFDHILVLWDYYNRI